MEFLSEKMLFCYSIETPIDITDIDFFDIFESCDILWQTKTRRTDNEDMFWTLLLNNLSELFIVAKITLPRLNIDTRAQRSVHPEFSSSCGFIDSDIVVLCTLGIDPVFDNTTRGIITPEKVDEKEQV